MKVCLAVMALTATMLADPAGANDLPDPTKTIREAEIRLLSDTMYMKILHASSQQGHHFTLEQVANGYKRHLEELRLQLLDQGYTIVDGQQEMRSDQDPSQPVGDGRSFRPAERTRSNYADSITR